MQSDLTPFDLITIWSLLITLCLWFWAGVWIILRTIIGG